jgi:predicted choloylglycine hydrolase
MTQSLTFTAVNEPQPGPKWKQRWDWSWPAYEAWFRTSGGDEGPGRADCEAALGRFMPEIAPVHRRLTELAGGGDRAARFLSGWCPPAYLGGCSLAAHAAGGDVRLVRNYDLSPDLNEGLLLRSEWTGRPVMGMIEFLWGLSDGINAKGLAVALAYGGSRAVGRGFGITMIVRYLLETCGTVATALARLRSLPSHMAYNLVLADAGGRVASVELFPGGGMRVMKEALATNHQHRAGLAPPPAANRTLERRRHLKELLSGPIAPAALRQRFLAEPLYQRNYDRGFGTLFTADYAPKTGGLTLAWPEDVWMQSIGAFKEGVRTVRYATKPETEAAFRPGDVPACPVHQRDKDWATFGLAIARRYSGPFTIPDFAATAAGGTPRITACPTACG